MHFLREIVPPDLSYIVYSPNSKKMQMQPFTNEQFIDNIS